jgi:hypothetical protein
MVIALVWFVFGKRSDPSPVQAVSERDRMTDAELWQQAEESNSAREALHYLRQIADGEELRKKVSKNVTGLLEEGPLTKPNNWPFYQGVIQIHGISASDLKELDPVAEIATNVKHTLTLRDTAFRTFVENAVRLESESRIHEEVLTLIDRLFPEANSLSGTALHAERFLATKGLLAADRESSFKTRLRSVLSSSQHAAEMRITALEMLQETDAATELPFEQLYTDAELSLQTSILRALSTTNLSESTKQWLKSIQPRTPEQEQLLFRIRTIADNDEGG